YAESFGDPTKGEQMANAMFEGGADIVYHVAGGTGLGVIAAAEASVTTPSASTPIRTVWRQDTFSHRWSSVVDVAHRGADQGLCGRQVPGRRDPEVWSAGKTALA
ncbi:BMP family ABC transporter substrate-binding protein, partial [Hoeflea alexandrii]